MLLKDLVYTFITEDGEFKMTLPEYDQADDLRRKIGLISSPPKGRQTVFLGTTIVSFPADLLIEDHVRRDAFKEAEEMLRLNPLRYFIPQNEDARTFLNDTETEMKGLLASNGYGKSVLGWIDVLLQFYPCDPKWEIFTQHGVNFRRYSGPRPDGGVGIVSYEKGNHITTIFPQIIQRWTPADALGGYQRGGKERINWNSPAPSFNLLDTPCHFLTASQSQFPFESVARDLYWWDEQGSEPKFNGANARIRRRNGRHTMTLTPHKIEGRPDTGAGSFIHKMYRGEITAGLKVKFYSTTMLDIPDWIYTKESKSAAINEWITEPMKNNDMYKLREGESRIYGKFQESSGLVYDNFMESVHMISPIKIEKKWPKIRAIDHGRIHPTAALMAAIHPSGAVIIYDEYYQTNKTISQNCRGIIEKCGNRMVEDQEYYDFQGRPFKRYYEEQTGTKFVWTKLDSRSFAKTLDDSAYTIGDMYRINGLSAQPASGVPNKKMIDIVKQYLEVDPNIKHPITGKMGCPRVLIFNTCGWFMKEMMGYINKVSIRYDATGQRIVSEDPIDRDDHLMTALMFLLSDPLTYVEGETEQKKDVDDDVFGRKELAFLARDVISGY